MNEPFTFVLFGATGDLAVRKILPALLSLHEKNAFSSDWIIVAFSRRPWSDGQYHDFVAESLDIRKEERIDFFKRVSYVEGTFGNSKGFETLKKKLDEGDVQRGIVSQKLFHVSIQPEFYTTLIRDLVDAGLNTPESKIILEKPIGRDLESAIALEDQLAKVFSEKQIYRIDHYLGKQGLRNMLEERKTDPSLESRLNNEHVESVHLRLLETIDIEGRGAFYDVTGTVRDVVQNHGLEMLAVFAMSLDESVSMTQRRNDLLMSACPKAKTVVRGQYHGYLDEKEVFPHSQTETYVKVAAELTTHGWKGAKFMVEAGKALGERAADIRVTFRDGSEKVFDMQSPSTPDAYETLISEAVAGTKEWFVTREEVTSLWTFVMPLLEQFAAVPLVSYPKGQ